MSSSEVKAHLKVVGEQQFRASMKGASVSMEDVGKAAHRAGGLIMRGLGTPLKMLSGLPAAMAAGGLIMLGKSALDAATSFDTSTRRISAFTGSMEQAKETMKFLEELSAPSIFGLDALAKAGALASAYGLNVQRVIPMAEAIATAMGDDAHAVEEVTKAIGRLKSGDFGEAFERLRDFGIGREDLTREGLKFDKQGSYKGSVIDALTAVEKIVDAKFGSIRKMMSDSPAAKFASAGDALQRTMKTAGEVIMGVLVPPMEKVTSMLDYLNKSGITKSVFDGLAGLFNLSGDGLAGGIAWIVAGLEQMPQLVTDVRDTVSGLLDMLAGGWNWVVDQFVGGVNNIRTAWADIKTGVRDFMGMIENFLDRIQNGFDSVQIALNSAIAGSNRLINNIPGLGDVNSKDTARYDAENRILQAAINGRNAAMAARGNRAPYLPNLITDDQKRRYQAFDDDGNASFGVLKDKIGHALDLSLFGGNFANIGNRADEIMAGFRNRQGGSNLDSIIAAGRKNPFFIGEGGQNPLDEIAENTRRTAANTDRMEDLKRFVIGGGERAQRAIANYELGGGGRGSMRITVNAGSRALNQALAEMFQDFMRQQRRVEGVR
jgi:hypothetical protein